MPKDSAEIAETLEVRAHGAAGGSRGSRIRHSRGIREAIPQKEEEDTGKHHHDDRSSIVDRYVLLAVLLLIIFRGDVREFVGPIMFLPVVVLVLASALAGFLTEYS